MVSDNKKMDVSVYINPIRPSLSSRSPGLGGGLGSEAQMPEIWFGNQGYHHPTEMKLCMSHYSHKSMPAAKFDSGNFSIFGDMTSQNFFLENGTSQRNRLFTRGKWV